MQQDVVVHEEPHVSGVKSITQPLKIMQAAYEVLFLKDLCERNPFQILENSVKWEEFSKGRKLAVLHRPTQLGVAGAEAVPLIRTTTIYQNPSQSFQLIHETIIEAINRIVSNVKHCQFNNAMLEIYDERYQTMKFHTDQALDIDANSYIAIYSCYENESEASPRILTVRNKSTSDEFMIQLNHNTTFLFSADFNQKNVHKIEAQKGESKGSRWMGLTLRLSKTFVSFDEKRVPHIELSSSSSRKELTLANEQQQQAFYRYKGLEN